MYFATFYYFFCNLYHPVPLLAIFRMYSPFLCLSLTIQILQSQDGSSHYPSRLDSECNNFGNEKIFNISILHAGYYERRFPAYSSSMSLLYWIFLNVISLYIFLCSPVIMVFSRKPIGVLKDNRKDQLVLKSMVISKYISNNTLHTY